jgi:hypothetical protein
MTETKAGAQGTPESASANTPAVTPKPAGDQPKGVAAGEAAAAATPAAEAGKAAGAAGTESGQPAGDTPKVPDKYDLKAPAGDEVYVDDRLLKRVETVARASGWSNADAQAALEEHLGNVKAELQEYLVVTKADPDYGGEKLAETQRLAKLVIDKVRPVGHKRRESFQGFVNRAGAFNHIEVVSFLADLGKLMAEDRPAAGGGPGGGERKRTADVLFDKTAPTT